MTFAQKCADKQRYDRDTPLELTVSALALAARNQAPALPTFLQRRATHLEIGR